MIKVCIFNKSKIWVRGLLYHPVGKQIGPILQFPGGQDPQRAKNNKRITAFTTNIQCLPSCDIF